MKLISKWVFLSVAFLAISASADHEGVVQRSFSCATVNPNYPSLDSNLVVRSQLQNGTFQFDTLFKFHRYEDCQRATGTLRSSCGFGNHCSALFCEADNEQYQTLETTMYQVRGDHSGRLSVGPVQQFRFMAECRQNLN